MQNVGLTVFETDWGWVGLASSKRGLLAVGFPHPSEEAAWREIRERWPEAELLGDEALADLKAKLRRFYAGEPVDFQPELALLDFPSGRCFYRKVWETVNKIPYGETRTYGEVAAAVGNPKASRAVGTAMATNQWPIIVPCHRVVGSGFRLTGFGGGLDLKARLLSMEKAVRQAK